MIPDTPFQTTSPSTKERRKRNGPALHGHARTLLVPPVQFVPDGSVPFHFAHGLLVPEFGGVYAIHDLRGVLYVGRSCDLKRRFDEHFWLAENELLLRARRNPFGELRFMWTLIDDEVARAALERNLVTWLQPPCNQVIPGLKH